MSGSCDPVRKIVEWGFVVLEVANGDVSVEQVQRDYSLVNEVVTNDSIAKEDEYCQAKGKRGVEPYTRLSKCILTTMHPLIR